MALRPTAKEPDVISDLIKKLYEDKELYKKVSFNNYNYAQSNFLASSAARRLEKIYRGLLE